MRRREREKLNDSRRERAVRKDNRKEGKNVKMARGRSEDGRDGQELLLKPRENRERWNDV